MNIYLIRHGETDWNKDYRFQGQVDIPLNAYGIELAEKTAEALKSVPFQAAFSSPLNRAVQTAQILIRDRKIPFETDARLKEINFGVYEGTIVPPGLTAADSNPLYDFRKQPENYIPGENGESLQALYKRSASFLQEKILPLEQIFQTILIVGHGALNRSILNPIAGYPLSDFWHISLGNCAVSRLSLCNGQFRVEEESRVYY